MSNKMTVCKTCGNEIAMSAKNCPKCGAKNKKPFYLNVWFWVAAFVFIGIVAGAGGSSEGGSGNTSTDEPRATVGAVASVFDGDCGITASAEIGNNIINVPELAVTVTNTTDKEIAAIKFYAVPYDVYGDEIKGWLAQSKLSTDISIQAGKTSTISYQFLDQTVKTVKLYVYSVYFADGTEWGNKDATTSKILKDAPTIEVKVKS